jgi:hypothetical protein
MQEGTESFPMDQAARSSYLNMNRIENMFPKSEHLRINLVKECISMDRIQQYQNSVGILIGEVEIGFSAFQKAVQTIYRGLADSLFFTVRHQTSSLGSSQALRQSEGKSSRVELSIQLRDLLVSIQHQG